MRDYVWHQSERHAATSGLPRLWSWVQNWRTRRSFARLAKLSDYQLRDIGLTHGEALYLSRLPLSVDLAWEADRLRLINSRRCS